MSRVNHDDINTIYPTMNRALEHTPQFWAEIIAWRKLRGLSTADLAALLDLTPQGVNKMIRENRPIAGYYRLALYALDLILTLDKTRADCLTPASEPVEPLSPAETAQIRALLRQMNTGA